MRLDVGLPIEIVTAGSDSNVSVCIRLGVEAIQRNCYNETNNNNNRRMSMSLQHYIILNVCTPTSSCTLQLYN